MGQFEMVLVDVAFSVRTFVVLRCETPRLRINYVEHLLPQMTCHGDQQISAKELLYISSRLFGILHNIQRFLRASY